jgi:hypothetical protein
VHPAQCEHSLTLKRLGSCAAGKRLEDLHAETSSLDTRKHVHTQPLHRTPHQVLAYHGQHCRAIRQASTPTKHTCLILVLQHLKGSNTAAHPPRRAQQCRANTSLDHPKGQNRRLHACLQTPEQVQQQKATAAPTDAPCVPSDPPLIHHLTIPPNTKGICTSHKPQSRSKPAQFLCCYTQNGMDKSRPKPVQALINIYTQTSTPHLASAKAKNSSALHSRWRCCT